MTDIHDIKPPIFIGFDPGITDILLIIFGGIILGLIIWLAVRLFKKGFFRKKHRNTLLLPPPLPAKKIAEKELAFIIDLMDKDRRLFYFKLTAVLKKYIKKQFGLNALEMTSQELIRSINTLDIESDLLNTTSKFVKFSDTIKYAAMPASKQKVEKDFNLIKEFVRATSEKLDKTVKEEVS